MLSKKKKFLILGIMVVLLGVTAYLNVALNNKVVDTSGTTMTTASFFATYRDDRQATRNQEIAYYDAIIASETTSAENKKEAETKRLELVAQWKKNLQWKILLKQKGLQMSSSQVHLEVLMLL